MPLVSVILPCFNGASFIEQAMRSVMQQTWRNLEIIVLDDCSTDESLSLIQQIALEDGRIKLLKNDHNLKLVATLNKGIDAAKGKYIARMDADDVCMPERIEKQVNFLENNPGIAMCGCNYIIIDKAGNRTGRVQFPSKSDLLKTELLFFSPFAHPSVMIRKEVLDDVGLYAEGLVPAEDYDLWIRINTKYRSANIPEFLLLYRWHGNNISVIKKHEQENAMRIILGKHTKEFCFAPSYLNYHLKFLTGTWHKESSLEEIARFNEWRKELISINKKSYFFEEHALRKTFAKYASLAYLAILKNTSNSLAVKFAAARRLTLINPLITLKHLAERGL